MDRPGKLRELCRVADGRGLEVGALNRPLVRKSEGAIYYADYTSTERLRRKSASDPAVRVEDIVEVDFDLSTGSLRELAEGVAPFDYVLASHVFEHIPDPLGWLASLEELLAPGGVISLAIPDKRYTFDLARRLTTAGDLVAYAAEKLARPSPVQLMDHYLNVRKVDLRLAWDTDLDPLSVERHHPDEQAMDLLRRSIEGGEYVDCHCTVWTDESFGQVMERARELGLLRLELARFHRTERYTHEFLVSLRKAGTVALAVPGRAGVREHRDCWLCGGPVSVYWEEPGADRSFNTRYLACGSCGLAMVSPMLEDPSVGLDESLHANYVNNIEAYTSLARFDSFLYMLDKMEASWFADGREGRGRMLEIGSAAGYFLAASRARGWEATGIEPAAEISEWSRRYLHVPAETKFFEQVEAGDGSLDAVVATEVLEHVVDPLAMLRRVRRMLKPAGMVFLTTPNVECPTARPGGPTAGILAPLDHLNLFSARALEALLRKAGFAEVRVEADGPDGFQLQAYAFAETGGKAVAGRPTAADLGRELAGLREANRALRAELAEANRLLESLGTAAST